MCHWLPFHLTSQDFGYEDDIVMAQLQGTMEDLRRSKLDLPPKAKANETPAMPFGLFTEPALTSDTSLTVTTKDDEKEVRYDVHYFYYHTAVRILVWLIHFDPFCFTSQFTFSLVQKGQRTLTEQLKGIQDFDQFS